MYVVFCISKSKFLKFVDSDVFSFEYTDELHGAMLFDSQCVAENYAFHCDEKVCVLKICSVL